MRKCRRSTVYNWMTNFPKRKSIKELYHVQVFNDLNVVMCFFKSSWSEMKTLLTKRLVEEKIETWITFFTWHTQIMHVNKKHKKTKTDRTYSYIGLGKLLKEIVIIFKHFSMLSYRQWHIWEPLNFLSSITCISLKLLHRFAVLSY